MIALMTVRGTPVAIEPDFIESVEAFDPEHHDTGSLEVTTDACIVRTSSGQEHVIARSYTYVTGILRKFYETH